MPESSPKALPLSLYLVATQGDRSQEEFLSIIKQAIEGGVDIIQLREKHLSSKAFYHLATKVKILCDRFQTPLLINDRIDIALACNASGVHIGQDDMPLSVARRILGDDKIIGLSVREPKHLSDLQKSGDIGSVDYLGVGAVRATTSKNDSAVIGINGLKSIIHQASQILRASQMTSQDPQDFIFQNPQNLKALQNLQEPSTSHTHRTFLPVVAIGGIDRDIITDLRGIGLSGIAVVRAIMDSSDPKRAACDLKKAFLDK